MIGHYVAISAVVVAVAVIIAASVYAQHWATATLYVEAVKVHGDWDAVEPIVHEGVRWSRNAHCEATIWAVVLVVLLVVVLGWSFWKEGLPSMA